MSKFSGANHYQNQRLFHRMCAGTMAIFCLCYSTTLRSENQFANKEKIHLKSSEISIESSKEVAFSSAEFINRKNSGLSEMKGDSSGNAMYYKWQATKSISENNYRDAITFLDEAIKADSTYYDAYLERLTLNLILGNSRSKNDLHVRGIAKRLIENQIQRNPGDQSLYVKRGHLRLMLDDFEGALQDGLSVLKTNANDFKANELISTIYQEMGQSGKAIPYQRKMMQIQSDNLKLSSTLALLYYDTYQLDRALDLLNELIIKHPEKAEFYVSRAGVKLRQGDQLAAKADFDKAISVDPNNYLSYRARGTYYLNSSSNETARNDLNKAIVLLGQEIARNPQNAPLILFRAEMTEQTGNIQGAINEYENYLRKWPVNYTAIINKAQNYSSLKLWKQAIDSYTAIINNFPEKTRIIFERSHAYQQMGNLQNALNDVNTVIRLYPNEYASVYFRSSIKYEMKDIPGCRRDLNISANLLNELSTKRELEQDEVNLLSQIHKKLEGISKLK